MAIPKRNKIERVYVKVASEFDSTGYMQPTSITWADGRTFPSLTGTVVMIDPVYRELKVMQDSDRKAMGIEKELPVIIPFDDIADLAGEDITSIEDYLGIEKHPDDI